VDTVNIKFSNKKSPTFIQDLKTQVNDYFKENNLSKKADTRMIVKTFVMLLLTFGPYAMIMSNQFGIWEMWALTFIMGVGVAGIGFSVSHDALHGAYSSNNKVNTALGLTFDLMGANGYLWKITHNVIHHTYTNIQGIDEDLEVSPLLRLSPESDHKPIHRFQHLYGFATYSLSTLFWVFVKDYKYLLQKNLGPYENIKHPKGEVALMIFMKLIYYTYMIVLPLIFLNVTWWQFVIGFLTIHLVAGTILGVIFQLAHVVEDTEHFTNKHTSVMEDAWLIHEMKTTANFGRNNKLLCWYVGGLNFQIEHHLFPKVCSIHYPKISPIVERVANEHGIPYNHQPTLSSAIGSHYKMLKLYGQGEGVTQNELVSQAG